MNKAILLGRLGSDPEVKAIQGGSVCRFSLATSEKWQGKDMNQHERTEWHKVVVFGKLAEICAKHLAKGSLVLVEGKIQTRSWEDQQGNKKYATEIVAHVARFLDQKKADSEEQYGDVPY